MTNQEARRRLLNIERSLPNTFRTKEGVRDFEALEMAIKALSQEPSGDAISRQAVKDCIDGYSQMIIRPNELKEYIDRLPPVNPQPKTGHWIYICNSAVNGLKIVKCSECGKRTYGRGNYCPNCGCKMEVEKWRWENDRTMARVKGNYHRNA